MTRKALQKLRLALLASFARLSIRDWSLGSFPNTVQQPIRIEVRRTEESCVDGVPQHYAALRPCSPKHGIRLETLYSCDVTHPEDFNLIFRLVQKSEARSVLVGFTNHSESES